MKNAARQPSACVAAPPSTGPIPLAIANVADTSAIQRTRWPASGNRSAGAANAVAIIMPPPMPCRVRNAISCGMLCARPQAIEPSATSDTDTSIRGLRPYISPSRPKIRIEAAVANR
ncbi:Uncharacterised protein [Bordetella pertussis]|nr:Uncharacterised protein [Bordetella pertussis]CFN55518.1 Uncharacterised protein [Bordetella pertussis]CFN91357.1 Uncharacterised protein [Bordetella pertussis]CFP53076.1 Uncharacterised protein [Bordetella pertussis]CPL77720.1 Uncharacterised protein [Bordetella pertussis]